MEIFKNQKQVAASMQALGEKTVAFLSISIMAIPPYSWLAGFALILSFIEMALKHSVMNIFKLSDRIKPAER